MGDRVRWAFRHDLPGESDEQLTDRARSGDKSAFGELYRRHRKAAESTAWCLLRSKSDADDVVADAFTGVLSALRNGRGPRDNFRAYLLACVRNGCRVRRMPPIPVSEDQLERWSPSLEDPERYVEANTVARAFSSLTPRWQHTLWLTEVEQQSPSEVSARMKLSPNATAALAHRARQAFATAYLAEHVAAVSNKECIRVAPHLAGYVRNQLSNAQLTAVERHLISCSHCSAAVAELRDVNTSLRSLLPAVPGALAGAGATLAAETSLVATTVGGLSLGLPGAGILLKGLVAVLLVAPVLSTDIPHGNGRSGQADENIVAVPEAAAAAGGDPTSARDVASPPAGESAGSIDEPDSTTAEGTSAADPEPALAPAGQPGSPINAGEAGGGELVATASTVELPATTTPATSGPPIVTAPSQLGDFVEGAVDNVVRPLIRMVTEPLVETLDEALALMGLGSTGETITMLRHLVPLLDGPLVGAVLDELLDLTSIVPADGSAEPTEPASESAPASGGLDDVPPTSSQTAAPSTAHPPAGSPSNPNAPAAPPGSYPPTTPSPAVLPDVPSMTLPSISLPAISLPAIVIPPISIPPIVIPIFGLPPITLPVISIPPITLPKLLG